MIYVVAALAIMLTAFAALYGFIHYLQARGSDSMRSALAGLLVFMMPIMLPIALILERIYWAALFASAGCIGLVHYANRRFPSLTEPSPIGFDGLPRFMQPEDVPPATGPSYISDQPIHLYRRNVGLVWAGWAWICTGHVVTVNGFLPTWYSAYVVSVIFLIGLAVFAWLAKGYARFGLYGGLNAVLLPLVFPLGFKFPWHPLFHWIVLSALTSLACAVISQRDPVRDSMVEEMRDDYYKKRGASGEVLASEEPRTAEREIAVAD